MSGNGKVMPNLDQQSTKILNLTVLQRIDQFVQQILFTAAHVTFYHFNCDLAQWSRKDVEGSLFVVKRNVQPRFQFIVMNRRNEDNLIENLLGDFEYEVQVPYLLYRNASQEVNGIWFYNPRECEEVDNLFQRILSAYAKVPTKLNLPSGKSKFEELETVPTMAVMEGPLEPSSATTSDIADAPDNRLFTNFFSGAMTLESSASVTIPRHPPSFLPSIPTMQIQRPPSLASNYFQPLLNNSENSHLKRTASLITSSFFNPPISSSIPTGPSIDPSNNLQRPYGTPLLQPFPPPFPSLSLTPLPPPAANYGPVTRRDEVRKVILSLVQNDEFIDPLSKQKPAKYKREKERKEKREKEEEEDEEEETTVSGFIPEAFPLRTNGGYP